MSWCGEASEPEAYLTLRCSATSTEASNVGEWDDGGWNESRPPPLPGLPYKPRPTQPPAGKAGDGGCDLVVVMETCARTGRVPPSWPTWLFLLLVSNPLMSSTWWGIVLCGLVFATLRHSSEPCGVCVLSTMHSLLGSRSWGLPLGTVAATTSAGRDSGLPLFSCSSSHFCNFHV